MVELHELSVRADDSNVGSTLNSVSDKDQGVATPPLKEARPVPPSPARISNGGGPPDAARLLPRLVPRRDLSEYLC
jgi:hypothetical protein